MPRKLDAIAAVEACYAPAATDEAWLEGLLRTLEPLDGGLGLYATRFDASCSERVRFHPAVVAVNPDERWAAGARRATFEGDPAAIQALYGPGPPVTLASERLRNMPAAVVGTHAPLRDRRDVLGVFARDVDGRGVLIGIPLRSRAAMPGPRLRHALAAISAHVTAARRLRALEPPAAWGDPDHADAILDAQGHVAHARGSATAHEAREALAGAVRSVERARGRARRVSPDDALELWKALVAGTWSLVDSVDTDGKRFVLARRNTPGVREPKALTQQERDVLAYAALGYANKHIAYLLGMMPSTVATHLSSAQRKLHLRSRIELIRTLAPRT
jgi:DNA-binding NarL/FixJ family response regulator